MSRGREVNLDNLVMFPGTRTAEVPQRPAPLAREARRMDLGAVGQAVGYGDFSQRVLIANLRRLIEAEGFPPPVSPRFVGRVRQHGKDAVWQRSVWDRDAVEQWLHGDLPPAQATVAVANDRSATRARLGQRAMLIAGGRNG